MVRGLFCKLFIFWLVILILGFICLWRKLRMSMVILLVLFMELVVLFEKGMMFGVGCLML